jgi:hypothetical protein
MLALTGMPALVTAQGQAGTTLTATVDTAAHWTRTFGWTIDKSVDHDVLNLESGGSGTVTYTIAVTKDAGTDAAWFDGNVYVTNGGAVATQGLAITVKLTAPSGGTVLGSATVDVSGNLVLDPGESGTYPYTITLSGPLTPGATYKVTANVTITNHSGSLGTAKGPSPSATTNFPSSPTLVNDAINVDDTNGQSFQFGATGSQSYQMTFTCDDAGENPNTATIRETGQYDTASVTVNCNSEPPAQLLWCSPGFWAQNGIVKGTLAGSLYDPTPYLNDPVPGFTQYTVGYALQNPNVVGGGAFNAAANYLSGIFFGPDAGTQATGDNCPINAQGEWIGS